MRLGLVAEIMAVIAMVGGGLVTLAAYHRYDQGIQLEKQRTEYTTMAGANKNQLDNIETEAVVSRIGRIDRLRCEGGIPEGLQPTLQEQLRRYRELTGREYTRPECRDD